MRRTDRLPALAWTGALMLAGHAVPAAAQYASGPSVTLEVASDERRRGLSWSDGAPMLRAGLSAPVASGFSLDATAVSLRGSRRHGGADAVIDLGPTFVRQIGGWRLSAQGRYHLFPDASHQGYGEVGAGAGFQLGPASLDLFVGYAPHQSAIGGDNLYLSATAAAGIPGTPLTVSARVGRSSGDGNDPLRAARLRPTGAYWDHGLGIDYLSGRWSAGVRYTDTDIAPGAADHAGARLVASLGLSL